MRPIVRLWDPAFARGRGAGVMYRSEHMMCIALTTVAPAGVACLGATRRKCLAGRLCR